MTPDRKAPAPLPAALLTLAVVMMLGGVAQPGQTERMVQQARRAVVADRDGLGQLVAALTDAARKLGQQQETQPALAGTGPRVYGLFREAGHLCSNAYDSPQPAPLRDELTHLPPPTLG